MLVVRKHMSAGVLHVSRTRRAHVRRNPTMPTTPAWPRLRFDSVGSIPLLPCARVLVPRFILVINADGCLEARIQVALHDDRFRLLWPSRQWGGHVIAMCAGRQNKESMTYAVEGAGGRVTVKVLCHCPAQRRRPNDAEHMSRPCRLVLLVSKAMYVFSFLIMQILECTWYLAFIEQQSHLDMLHARRGLVARRGAHCLCCRLGVCFATM